jgi:hypothetical protein
MFCTSNNKTDTYIQQYLLQQMDNLIFIQSKLAYMFRPIRPSSGQQSLGIPRIQLCQNKQITLKVVWYVAICKMSCVYVIDNVIYNIYTGFKLQWVVTSVLTYCTLSSSAWFGDRIAPMALMLVLCVVSKKKAKCRTKKQVRMKYRVRENTKKKSRSGVQSGRGAHWTSLSCE